jgi:acyl-CoA thioester hydrolase
MPSVEGFGFSTELQVRFNETDAQGIVHNAVYLVWFEIARIAYLARFPGGYRGIVEQHGVDVTTVESHVRYRAPARFDDRLRVWARTVDLRGTRFRFEYLIERLGPEGGVLADGATQHACVDATSLRPVRMPGWLAQALAELEEPGASRAALPER